MLKEPRDETTLRLILSMSLKGGIGEPVLRGRGGSPSEGL